MEVTVKSLTSLLWLSVDAADTWCIGFITQNDVAQFGLLDHVAVYVPLSYSLTGVVYFVPKEKIKPLTRINGAEAMKFVISGGITQFEDQQETKH